MQYFFLNGRYIKSRSCVSSMENAYKNSIMVGKFPSCVLNVKVRPDVVDINVHPAKTEVRFSDERKVSSAVYFAVKSALESIDTMPELNLSKATKVTQRAMPESVQLNMLDNEPEKKADFKSSIFSGKPTETKPTTMKAEPKKDFWQSMPVKDFSAKTDETPKVKLSKADENEPDLISNVMLDIAKKKEEIRRNVPDVRKSPVIEEMPLIVAEDDGFSDVVTEAFEAQDNAVTETEIIIETEKEPEIIKKPFVLLGEVFKTYIICEYDGRVVMIDKHAAHERIIYNKMKAAAKENIASQVLLSAIKVTLAKNEYTAVIENIDAFKSAGYLIEDFGDGVVVIRECPMLISGDDVEDTVIEMASYLAENRTNIETETIDRIHHTAACKAAIKAGYKNSLSEMRVLAEQVLYDESVRYCPHGRPVFIELTKYELEKQFGRIQ